MECQPARGAGRGNRLRASPQELPTERRSLAHAASPQPAPSPTAGCWGQGVGGLRQRASLGSPAQKPEPCLPIRPQGISKLAFAESPPPGSHLFQGQETAGNSALRLRTDSLTRFTRWAGSKCLWQRLCCQSRGGGSVLGCPSGTKSSKGAPHPSLGDPQDAP